MRLLHHHQRCHRHRCHGDSGSQHEMPLSMADPAEELCVKAIRGGPRMRRRLAELGLNVGCPVSVIRADPSGRLIVAIKGDSRLALGRGMAHRIMVESTNEELR